MTQLILGLGNKARHGKDTFAAAVDSHYATQYYAAAKHGLTHYQPVVVQQIAFADALYREVNSFLSWQVGQLWQSDRCAPFVAGIQLPSWVKATPDAEKSTRSPYGKHPKLLQWWGTEFRRQQDPDYWVKQWQAAINPKANIVITTDMRFFNEAAAIKTSGGYTVRVARLNADNSLFEDPSRDPQHRSEVELDDYNFDYNIIVKTGDQALLEEYAITLVHYLRALKGHK